MKRLEASAAPDDTECCLGEVKPASLVGEGSRRFEEAPSRIAWRELLTEAGGDLTEAALAVLVAEEEAGMVKEVVGGLETGVRLVSGFLSIAAGVEGEAELNEGEADVPGVGDDVEVRAGPNPATFAVG